MTETTLAETMVEREAENTNENTTLWFSSRSRILWKYLMHMSYVESAQL